MKTDFDRELDDIFQNVTPEAEAEALLAFDIALQFVALRERRKLTQAALAARLGKSQQAISKIENPTHGGHTLARLKEVLKELDATLDVTIVPNEDLDLYQTLYLPKPVLEDLTLYANQVQADDLDAELVSTRQACANSRRTRPALWTNKVPVKQRSNSAPWPLKGNGMRPPRLWRMDTDVRFGLHANVHLR